MDWFKGVKALILAGGDVHITQRLINQLADVELVIAADSGIRHAHALSVMPNLLVGDFDSISAEDLALYETVPRVEHQPEKDDLDLELAIQEARAKNASDLILVGATGSRLDQSLAGIMIAAKHKTGSKAAFQRVRLLTGKQELEILQTDDSIELSNTPLATFSLLSLVPKSILSIKNAKYPLDHATLEFGTGLGVSNEMLASGNPHISLHSGLCVLIVELDTY